MSRSSSCSIQIEDISSNLILLEIVVSHRLRATLEMIFVVTGFFEVRKEGRCSSKFSSSLIFLCSKIDSEPERFVNKRFEVVITCLLETFYLTVDQ